MSTERFVHPDHIRTLFSAAISEIYCREVPLYGTLLDLVGDVNRRTDAASGDDTPRIAVERHGAIRLGSAAELATARRLFAVMGMQPVGYYDLSVAGLPVHATAFRPLAAEALTHNPFRVFTSLLRLDLIADAGLRAEAQRLIAARRIFTPRCLRLIEQAETAGGLDAEDAQAFVHEALQTFRWHSRATVSASLYQAFHDAHPLLADIACFPGPHINHLTPRTLDIDDVHASMAERGLQPKKTIEGPPRRRVPILLRQTSFMAIGESVAFADGATPGTHTARFGEVEQRGCALTPTGRALYDELTAHALEADAAESNLEHQQRLDRIFNRFPDTIGALREQGLVYCRYRIANTDGPIEPADAGSFEALIDRGRIVCEPIVYEDFLPVSAAGIFRSNLGHDDAELAVADARRDSFEAALGANVNDPFALYAAAQAHSRNECAQALGLQP